MAFTYGEEIKYKIYYNLASIWIEAGKVTFTVDSSRINNKIFFKITGIGETLEKYDWVYKVRDEYVTIVESEYLQPIRFIRNVEEGNTNIYEDYVFNHHSNTVITLRKMDKDDDFVKDTLAISSCSFDVLSMIYHARNLNFDGLKIGDTIPISIFLDNEEHASYIRYLGKEKLKVLDNKEVNCIKFKPLLIEGTIFNAGEDMTVWVSDDKNKIPLLIETPILIGSIKAKAISISGKRN